MATEHQSGEDLACGEEQDTSNSQQILLRSLLKSFRAGGRGDGHVLKHTKKSSVVDPDSLNPDTNLGPEFKVFGSGYGSRVLMSKN
jgi:hypothetical protein